MFEMVLMEDVFEHSGPARLVAGGVWFLTLMVLGGLFWWLLSVIVSRTYGPVGYGIFSTAQALHNFAWVFVFGGLFQGLIKYGSEYVTKNEWHLKKYFSAALRFLTIIGIIMFIVISIIGLSLSDPIMRIMVLSIALSFLFTGTKDALASIIGSFQKSDHLSIVTSTRSMALFVAGLVFMLFNIPSYMLPVLLIIGTLWQLTLCIYFLRSRLRDIIPFKTSGLLDSSKQENLEIIKRFWSIAIFGFFISLGMISFSVMKSLDIIVLNMFFSYGDVGIYSVADTSSSILFFMTSFSLPVIPAIAEAYVKKNKELLVDYVKISIKYPLIIGIPLTVIILTMAEPIIINIYGPAFAEAVVPLQILIIGTFMLMLGYNLSAILIGIGKPNISGVLMAIAAVQYIISLFILTPMFGFIGAALSLTLTGVTSMLLVPYFLKRELQVSVYSGLHKVLVSAAAMMLALIIVPKSNPFLVFFGIVGGVALFIALLRLTGYLTQEDMEMMKIAGGTFKRKGSTRKKLVKRRNKRG